MATEAEKTETPERSALRRVGRVAWNFINPFSDLVEIWRRGGRPTVDRLELAWKVLREWSRPRQGGPELTWREAVERTGKPVELIYTAFRRSQVLWWWLMAVTGCLALSLFGVLLLAWAGLPASTLLRASIALLILGCLSGVGFVKALVATYRLWQLKSERVSLEERGTFQDFMDENQWCRQVLLLKR